MVQETGRRARNRLARHAAFLRSARAVVASEGLEGLTMQRLAADVDCAVGTAYTYFPSKSALVAELQRDAIEVLTTSYLRFRAALDGTAGADPLTHLVGFSRFWVSTFDTLPDEARLLQLLMAESGGSVIADEDVGRVLPAAERLLGHARGAFDDAAAAGQLAPGDAMERTVVLAASLNGVLAVERVARIDPDLFDGPRLAAGLTADLLAAWGADRAALAAAARRLDALARRGPLAPPVPRSNP